MEIDTTFPTKLDTVSDAPEPLRSALVETLPSGEPVRLLLHSPSFPTGDAKSPATVLAVTNTGWLVASETEEGGATVEKSEFSDILFLELTFVLLLGQLRISFARVDTPSSVIIKFEGVGEAFYHEAIDLILAGIDPTPATATGKDRNEASTFKNWPMKFRNEARHYWPRGQTLLSALRWQAIPGESQAEIAPAGALLITERELVLISDEKKSSEEAPSEEDAKGRPSEEKASLRETNPETTLFADLDPGTLPGDVYEYGEIIAFVPHVRLSSFQVSHQERCGVLALQVSAAHGREKLEILFPSDQETAVSKAMEQVSLSRGSSA